MAGKGWTALRMSWLPTAIPLNYSQIELPGEIPARTGRPSLRVAAPGALEANQDEYFVLCRYSHGTVAET